MNSDTTLEFFADILLDFSSYYTRDIFRATSLNTFHRCEEILRFIREMENSGLREGAVSSLLDELVSFGKRDLVIKSKFQDDWDQLETLFEEKTQSSKFFAVSRLHKRLEGTYLRDCRNLIESKVSAGNSSPSDGGDELLRLTELFYSHLINCGHSEPEIYRQTLAIIKKRPSSSKPVRILQDLFSVFPCRLRAFDAYVSAASELSAALLNGVAEGVTGDVPVKIYERHKDTLNTGDASKSVFLLKSIQAFDFGDARAKAEEKLVLARSISYTMNVHSEPSWIDRMVIVESETSEEQAVEGPLSPMRWRRRVSDKFARRVVGERVSSLLGDQFNSEVADKIRNSITEYANGFHADGLSTQLISVWSALEGLLPRVVGKENRIAEISSIVCTCQRAAYFRNILQWVFSLHRENDSEEFLEIISPITEPKSELSRFGLALLDPKYREISNKLRDFMEGKPLAQLRTYRLITKLKNHKSIMSALDGLEQKVDWQLRRLYLERNRIVHNASPSKNVESLLANLCEYYLSCLDILLDELARSPKYSIDFAFQEAALRQKLRTRSLSSGSKDLSVALGFALTH